MSISLDPIEIDDEMKISNVVSIEPALKSPAPIQQELKQTSSINRSTIDKLPPLHHPTLPPVHEHMLIPFLDAIKGEEKTFDRETKIRETLSNQHIDGLKKINAATQEALEKEAANVQSRSTWSTFATVSQYVSSAASIVLAASTGGLSAAFLIGSGVIGISIGIAHDTNLLNSAVAWYTKSEQRRQEIANNIHLGAFCLQMGLGLAGGAWSWKTGSLGAARISGDTIKTQMLSTVTGASSLATVSAKIGESYYHREIAYLRRELKTLDGEKINEEFEFAKNIKSLNIAVETSQQEIDCASASIYNLSNLID